jgi:hypothetical protein
MPSKSPRFAEGKAAESALEPLPEEGRRQRRRRPRAFQDFGDAGPVVSHRPMFGTAGPPLKRLKSLKGWAPIYFQESDLLEAMAA